MNKFQFVQNTACEYFPCHSNIPEKEFNCLFCYCPLYALGNSCGGEFRYTQSGIKDCTRCGRPHTKSGYGYILSNIHRILEMTKDTSAKL